VLYYALTLCSILSLPSCDRVTLTGREDKTLNLLLRAVTSRRIHRITRWHPFQECMLRLFNNLITLKIVNLFGFLWVSPNHVSRSAALSRAVRTTRSHSYSTVREWRPKFSAQLNMMDRWGLLYPAAHKCHPFRKILRNVASKQYVWIKNVIQNMFHNFWRISPLWYSKLLNIKEEMCDLVVCYHSLTVHFHRWYVQC